MHGLSDGWRCAAALIWRVCRRKTLLGEAARPPRPFGARGDTGYSLRMIRFKDAPPPEKAPDGKARKVAPPAPPAPAEAAPALDLDDGAPPARAKAKKGFARKTPMTGA